MQEKNDKITYELLAAESGLFIVIDSNTGNHIAKGFNDIESALHAIWVIENRPKGMSFRADKNNFVYLEKDKEEIE